jgi:tripartite-type tricarboxylate transporter receptor subunit TctC
MTIARSSPATDVCYFSVNASDFHVPRGTSSWRNNNHNKVREALGTARENSMPLIDRRAVSLLGLAAILSPIGTFAAESYPSRPIHLIVGFTAGATSDVIARIFAQAADPLLGQQVVVENKPGAGSSIAAEYVARSVNDGYTLFVPALSTLTDEIVNPDRSTRLGRDFSPIALLGDIAIVLIVNPKANVRSVSGLIALAKSNPGQVSFASVGAGTLPHLAAVLFAQRAGIQMLHVPYPGSPQAVTDVMAGRITMFFAPASSIIGQVASGKVLALATAADKRSSALPEVPTMAEAGMPNFDTSLWLGLLGPAGLPQPIVDKLAGATQKAMQAPKSAAALVKQGYDQHFLGPDQFAAFIGSEKARWSAVASAAGLSSKG